MKDMDKTKEQLINELVELPQRVAELETLKREHEQTEKALRESEERYALTTSAGQVGVWDWNLETNEIYLDPNLKAMLGYADHEIGNHLDDWGKFVHPDDAEQVMAEANAHLEGLTPRYETAHRMLHKDGSVRWFLARGTAMRDANGKAYRVLGTDTNITERKRVQEELRKHRERLEELVEERTAELRTTNERLEQEITDRKRAEEALQESEEKYRALFENANDAIFIADVETGVLLDANRETERLIGRSRMEIIGMHQSQLHPADKVEHYKQKFCEHVERGQVADYEGEIVKKDGAIAPVYISSATMELQGKKVIQGLFRDVSERKRLEEQLLWSQKMETVGRLAGGVAHEFNNHLLVILLNAELAMMRLSPGSSIRRYLEAILRNTDYASKVVGKLLTFSRRQVIKPQVINLRDVLVEMDTMLRPLIGENIELVTLPGEDLGRIRMDRNQIEQALVNLVVNARDAMPRGGKLTIVATNITIDEDHAWQHADIIPGQYIVLEVSDTGLGMTEEVQAHLFEPFYTTKEVGKGTGLGLATCYGIVKQNGGNIWAHSEPGKGTTLKIYLPRVEEEAEVLPKHDESECLQRGTETVLLVEDDPSVRDVVARTLREQGYTVLEAATGEEGLRVAEENGGKKIHLLLTDVVMPQMGGNELAQRLRTNRPDIKVIFFSGYPGEAIPLHGISDTGIAFLQKPFSPAVVLQKVREVQNR